MGGVQSEPVGEPAHDSIGSPQISDHFCSTDKIDLKNEASSFQRNLGTSVIGIEGGVQ